MKKIIITLCFLCITTLLGGCAFDVIHVEHIPAKLDTDTSCNDYFVLTQDIDVQVGSGYNRRLKKGTRWNCVGKIAEGVVYKTNDQVLTVEASNIFEANIVVSSKKLVGFYLPVERTFTPLDTQTKLVMQESISNRAINQ